MSRGSAVPRALLALGLVLALLAGISVFVTQSDETGTAPAPEALPEARVSELLNATLWVQTSAEYVGAAEQAYRLARLMLDRALEDPAWTAALEQAEAGGYEALPPAVILDVDETVLDNSPYQARQILDHFEFETPTWHDWVREEKATPVPGALEFAQYAAERGVIVFYVTNRRAEVEDPTRRNLERFGFPFVDGIDTLLTRDEREDWGSDKGSRRRVVGADHRILLLIGDNFGDFASGIDTTVEARAQLAEQYAEMWGSRWILLPNPQYGSWDGALIDYEYGLDWQDKRARKAGALDPAR
jgi:5'-nucleotidase (lipoprotein e(P4) family)